MKIAFGVDPSGWPLHDGLIDYLKEQGHTVLDVGTTDPVHAAVPFMYAGTAVAKKVADGEADLGITACGSGMGVAIAANKQKGVRCALCEHPYTAKQSRIVNNANVLALGGKFTTLHIATEIVHEFLNTAWCEGVGEATTCQFEADAKAFAEVEAQLCK